MTSAETLRKAAFVAVASWIEEAQGKEAANAWAWGCTPYPFGLPSDEMLDDGLAVATGALDIRILQGRIEEEMTRDLAAYNAQRHADASAL